MPNLETIEGITVYAAEEGVITLSGPETLMGAQVLSITDAGRLNLPTITEMTDVSIFLTTGSVLDAPLLTAMRAGDSNSYVSVGGGVLSLPVDTLVNVRLEVSGGGLLELPQLTLLEWRDRCVGGADYALASRFAGAVLSLPALQTISLDSAGVCVPVNGYLLAETVNDGTINMPELVTIELGSGGEGETAYSDLFSFRSVGESSVIDVSKLTNFPEAQVTFSTSEGGVILRP
jgi:hypothetical protein